MPQDSNESLVCLVYLISKVGSFLTQDVWSDNFLSLTGWLGLDRQREEASKGGPCSLEKREEGRKLKVIYYTRRARREEETGWLRNIWRKEGRKD